MEQKIRARLEEMRESLKAHGGDLQVESIAGTVVRLKLKGACGTCPHAMITLKQGIESTLRDEIDEKITVEQAT